MQNVVWGAPHLFRTSNTCKTKKSTDKQSVLPLNCHLNVDPLWSLQPARTPLFIMQI